MAPRSLVHYLDCPRCGLVVRREAAPGADGSLVCPECRRRGFRVEMRFQHPVIEHR